LPSPNSARAGSIAPTSDGGLAERLADGRGFVDEDGAPHARRTPAIPFLVSLVYRAVGPRVEAARVFMCALASLLVPACYLLAAALGGRGAGIASAAAAALMPTWIYHSPAILVDLAAATLTALASWALIEGWRRGALSWVALAGLLWGAGALVRPTLLVLGPALVAWAIVVFVPLRRRLAAAATLVAPAAHVIQPWTARNASVLDRPVLLSSQGGLTLWMSNNPQSTGVLAVDWAYAAANADRLFPPRDYASELEQSRALEQDALRFMREDTAAFARLCFVRLLEFWKPFSPRAGAAANLAMLASYGLLLPFFLLWVARRGWRRGPELLLVLVIATQTALHTIFSASVRYRIPIEPLILALATAGLFWLVDRVRPRRA
jgi:4-amino-4-deoxy-L-arabinose transferase-like glycosyltransferase